MRVLLPLMLLLTGTTSSRSATGQTTMTTTPTTITTPTTSAGFRSGWAECTGISPSARQVHKSWRSFAQHAHPDTAGGSGDSNDFQNSVLLRDALKDPDHFQIYKLLQNLTTVIPFNESSNVPGGVVTTADLQVVQKCTNLLDKNSCAPYAKLRAQFSLAEPTVGGSGSGASLPRGAAWTLALGAQNVSTIQYHGDTARGGYDVCCDFVENSRCVRQQQQQQHPTSHGAGVDPSLKKGGGAPPDPWLYAVHDCPVPGAFTAEVLRPLHVMRSGQWAATISIRDGAGEELACVAAAMAVDPSDVAAADHPRQCNSKVDGRNNGINDINAINGVDDANGINSDCPDSSTKARPPAAEAVEQVTFELVDRGVFCEDGIDLLEGSLDSYTDCTDIEGVCMLTAKCRAKCRKKKQCNFYTTYRNGWCQLSSSCSRRQKAGDVTARTFRKVTTLSRGMDSRL